MKKALLTIGLITLLCLVGWTSYGQKQNSFRITWEYRLAFEGSSTQKQVNLQAIGAEGWELTAVTTGEEVIGEAHYPTKTYYFKRPK